MECRKENMLLSVGTDIAQILVGCSFVHVLHLLLKKCFNVVFEVCTGCGRLDGKEAVNIFADVDILSSCMNCSFIHDGSYIYRKCKYYISEFQVLNIFCDVIYHVYHIQIGK